MARLMSMVYISSENVKCVFHVSKRVLVSLFTPPPPPIAVAAAVAITTTRPASKVVL